MILAIKPSFEEDVVSLLDTGHLGALSPASRFKVAVDAVRATEQNYENRRAEATAPSEAGVEPEDLAASSGNLIGEWLDWTPTSALDMDVQLKDLL